MQKTQYNLACLVMSLFGIIGVWIIPPSVYAQTPPNTVTLDNQSGDFTLVQVIGPTGHLVEVPQGQKRTVNVAEGEYYLLARYGERPESYRYTKGKSFNVTQSATQYSALTITLHKVVGGNYPTQPTSREEFEKALSSLRPENQLNRSGEDHIEQSSYFHPVSGKGGLVAYEYGKEGFLFKINNTQYAGYLVLQIRNSNTEAGLLPRLFVYKFVDEKSEKSLVIIGSVNIEHIKEIEILEEDRDYSEKTKNFQYSMKRPYFKAKIMLRDNKDYIVLIPAFDLVEGKNNPLKFGSSGLMLVEDGASIQRIKKGTTLVHLTN